MKLEDLNSLSVDNIGNWPIPVKAAIIAILCAAMAGAGFWYDTQPQLDQLAREEATEESLREEYKKKQLQANALEQLKQQLAEIKSSFGELLKRLPGKTEVEGVLVDISQAGLASGLTFELFQPGDEKKGEGGFYMELPLQLRMTGDYHSFGKFISDVAALPRIVTQHEISIQPLPSTGKPDPKGKPAKELLRMDTIAKTYRYLDESEVQSEKKDKKPATAPKK